MTIKKLSDRHISKGYIGVTKNLDKRWKQHRADCATKTDRLHTAMAGKLAFNEVIKESERVLYGDQKGWRCVAMFSCDNGYEAYEKEEQLISDYNLTKNGLNTSEGGIMSDKSNINEPHIVYYIYSPALIT